MALVEERRRRRRVVMRGAEKGGGEFIGEIDDEQDQERSGRNG
jgi:hypothetical protein